MWGILKDKISGHTHEDKYLQLLFVFFGKWFDLPLIMCCLDFILCHLRIFLFVPLGVTWLFARNIFVLSLQSVFSLTVQLELAVSYFIFILYSISLITACTIQPNVVSLWFLLVLSYSPTGDFPSYTMCGHAARQVRAVLTCRRYQYGNKGPLVRSLGDTWASIVILPPQRWCG